jgi:hypothetical protein
LRVPSERARGRDAADPCNELPPPDHQQISAALIGESPHIAKITITLRRKECDVAHTSLQLRR